MNRNIRFLVAGLLIATVVLAPVAGMAQDKADKPKAPAAGSSPEKSAPAARALPFRGTVAAVDKEAKTVTVGKQVFQISSDTKLIKGNQPGDVADINVGDVISGNYTKSDDGKLTAKMMRFGPKTASERSETKAVDKKKENSAE